jgi:hypothetical protein
MLMTKEKKRRLEVIGQLIAEPRVDVEDAEETEGLEEG